MNTPPVPPSESMLSPAEQKAIDAAIAQYNSLRAEILGRQSAQGTLFGAGLAAVGVIVGFAVGSGRPPEILLGVTAVCAVVIAVYSGHDIEVMRIGQFIRRELWPYLQSMTDQAPPSWEMTIHGMLHGRRFWLKNAGFVTVVYLFYFIGMATALIAPQVPFAVKLASMVTVTVVMALSAIFVIRTRRGFRQS